LEILTLLGWGKQLSFAQLSSFNNFIDNCSLSNIRRALIKWSWHNNSIGNNRILGRLDLLPESFYKYHSIASSDHAPILLHFLPDQEAGPKPFKFFNFWMELPNFQNTLNEAWTLEVAGNPLYLLATYLKNVKKSLKL